MRGAVLYGPRDVRFEERDVPKIINPTDAVIRISSACVCGSDLWPYRGIQPTAQPTPMGHEYCGIVEEVDRPEGVVPHFLPGTNTSLAEFPAHHDLPAEAAKGGAETMYPKYQSKLRQK